MLIQLGREYSSGGKKTNTVTGSFFQDIVLSNHTYNISFYTTCLYTDCLYLVPKPDFFCPVKQLIIIIIILSLMLIFMKCMA